MKNYLLPAMLAVATVLPAGAVRAKQTPWTVTQPDGSVLTVKKVGDERSHYLLTTDDCLLAEREGVYYFAELSTDGEVVPTSVLAANPSVRSAVQRSAAMSFTPAVMAEANKRRAKSQRRVIPQYGMGLSSSTFPSTGDVRGLVILVEYRDVKFTLDDPADYFTAMLNEDGFSRYGGTGCAAEYFRQNSHDLFRPQFDVLGPVTLPNNRKYYGGNDRSGNDRAAEEMVIDAVKALDATVDFSKYDMDGDGYVDNVFIFYAGVGEASADVADSVWPHSWDLSAAGKSFKVDGVTVDHYACTNEWVENRPDGVGTFIHEFSHVMGLPDLYDTTGNHACTPCEWSVLDYGPYNNNGCTPPNYSIYERNAMGWMEPEVITGAKNGSLLPVNESNHGYLIPTSKSNEFFLLENRQQKGWDAYLPGHGMLIWHVDFNQQIFDDNVVNDSKSHQYVELEKANGILDGSEYSVLAGWSWPGSTGATEFTDDTKPSMKMWNGERLNLPITGIAERDGRVTFFVAGGENPLDTPVALEPLATGVDWFDASWEPVEGATDYLLTVLRAEEGAGEEIIDVDMGTGSKATFPEGWTSSTTDTYTTSSNYGKAKPSLKLNTTGAWVRTPDFSGDIQSVTFWCKGQSTDDKSVLVVSAIQEDGSVRGSWTVKPVNGQGNTVTLDGLPSGIRALKFEYTKSVGNLALDDIHLVVTGGLKVTPLEGYDAVSTGGATTMRVHDVPVDDATYSYYVVATDGELYSHRSNTVLVQLSSSAVNAIASSDLVVRGRELMVYGAENVRVYDVAGRTVAAGSTVTLPTAGVYTVVADGKVAKVMVK